MEKTNFISTARKVGGSYMLVIDKDIAKTLNIKSGDVCKILLEKLDIDKKIISYRCPLCEHRVEIEEGDDIYCPACGNEDNLEEVNEMS